MDGLTSFSLVPLRLATYAGFGASAVAMLGILFAVCVRLFTREWVPGWAGLFVAVLFIGGVQLVTIGIVGEYVGRIYAEVKRRPLYLLQERIGFGPTSEGLLQPIRAARGERPSSAAGRAALRGEAPVPASERRAHATVGASD